MSTTNDVVYLKCWLFISERVDDRGVGEEWEKQKTKYDDVACLFSMKEPFISW